MGFGSLRSGNQLGHNQGLRERSPDLSDPIPISALEHYWYCERQAALITVDGLWIDNRHVLRGHRGHKRVDSGRQSTGRRKTTLRSVRLWSERLGLTGVADAIELQDDGSVLPVEYKVGVRHGRAAEVQVAAQALCLEEMFNTHIDQVAVWYSGPRRRQTHALDTALRELTISTIAAVHALRSGGKLPDAPNDERCNECQLLTTCLPFVVAEPHRAEDYVDQEVFRCRS